ncbi:iron-siderophore ABC transporter substrate-binding protein [Scytonema sp. NUACC26]|uniref:iron-siderophore ABC transporter substrate-binding protein n=1 Tax=Scytonema sp. NUACC26 TaxID=3140176 RepID=UPI0034DC2D01
MRRISLKVLLLEVLTALCTCSYFFSSLVTSSPVIALEMPSSPKAMRVVQHSLSQVQVPVHPQRVVALHPFILEDALVLGVKPIGGPRATFYQLNISAQQLQGIEDVGWFPPNFEKILRLKPDLILASSFDRDIYPLLAHIAPTVLIEYRSSDTWKLTFEQCAEVLNKSEQAKQMMKHYYIRLAKFKTQMKERLQKIQVSVLSVSSQDISLYGTNGFIGAILKDAGLTRPPSQNLDTSTILKKGGTRIRYSISQELLSEADGDVLFVVQASDRSNINSQKALQQLQAQPLWSKLKAVQYNKAHVVGVYWLGYSPVSAQYVIDDLFQFVASE